MVPGYCSPSVKMRLLSPQDYARHHKLSTKHPQFSGNADWMHMELAGDGNDMIFANMDPNARLPFVFGEAAHANGATKSLETRCHCHVTSIFDVTNINLTPAQRFLKLDHDRMGHISMQSIQRLYQPAGEDSPDFDGVSTSKKPCIVAKDPAQLRCSPPRCEACLCARARKRPTNAKHSKPDPQNTDVIRAEDLRVGGPI